MDVLVRGAGVAGTAPAYWLRHHGFTPTVVERAPRVRTGGYAAALRGEAAAALVAKRSKNDKCELTSVGMSASSSLPG